MLDKLLRLKHWQIFLVFFAVPFVIGMTFYAYMIAEFIQFAEQHKEPNPEDIRDIMSSFFSWFLPIFIIVYFAVTLLYWSYGVKLQEYLVPSAKRKTTFFKITLIFPFIYFLAIFMFMINLFPNFAELDESTHATIQDVFPFNPSLLVLIIPCHFFAIFCQFYNFYFMAKTVKSGQLGRMAKSGDYIGEFFLFWFFFPIGIWILQPMANKIVSRDAENEDNLIVTD